MRLLDQDYPSDAPRQLALTIPRICSTLRDAALAMTKAIDWTSESVDGDLDLLRWLDRIVQQLGEQLRYIETSEAHHVPWSVIPSFEKLAKDLVSDVDIMLRPQWHYNYATYMWDFRQSYIGFLGSLNEYGFVSVNVDNDVLREMPRPFHLISFPTIERRNILLHTSLGHEIGHLIVRDFLSEDRITDAVYRVGDDIQQNASDVLNRKGMSSDTMGPLFYQQAMEEQSVNDGYLVKELWKRAMEELLADAVGAYLFGPASLFASFDTAMQDSLDRQPTLQEGWYPPWRRRLAQILSILDENVKGAQFFPVPGEVFQIEEPEEKTRRAERVNHRVDYIRQVVESPAGATSSANPLVDIAYIHIDEDLRAGRQFLLEDRKLSRFRTEATALYRQLPSLLERLEWRIPPSAIVETPEECQVPTLVGIINAAWFHRISLETSAVGDPNAVEQKLLPDRRRLDNLTLKAVEFAELSIEKATNCRQASTSGEGETP